MNHLRTTLALAALAIAARVPAQGPIKGILETYFFSTRADRGAVQKLTWGEFYYRPSENLKLTYSFGIVPNGHLTDEACLAYDNKNLLVRVGRMRTSFGFNDWANLFYNGFNHVPLVRMTGLANGYALWRQDSGVEVTSTLGDVQVMVAGVDSTLERDQITPNDIDTGIVRLQAPIGPFILGLDSFKKLRHEGGIYGFDLRYTAPRIVGRLEYFKGDGSGAAQGYHADVQYRIPKLTRTQLVGMTELLKADASRRSTTLHTLGLRQMVGNNFQLNINYGWGNNLAGAPFFPAQGVDNWSARGLFQIHF